MKFGILFLGDNFIGDKIIGVLKTEECPFYFQNFKIYFKIYIEEDKLYKKLFYFRNKIFKNYNCIKYSLDFFIYENREFSEENICDSFNNLLFLSEENLLLEEKFKRIFL